MSVVIDGTSGITTPAETVQGALTTTGNTILGDASTDTLNVGNGGLVKDASGNVGIGTASPSQKLDVVGSVKASVNVFSGDDYAFVFGSGTTSYLTGSSSTNYIAAVTASTERMRIDSTGASTFTGTGKFATTIGVGNATPSASGSGITFPATQSASSDANTLDDYEEGTFTPTSAAGLTGTGLSLSGKYTKIGNVVTVQIYVTGTSVATAGTAILMNSLPFVASATVGGISLGSYANQGNTNWRGIFIVAASIYSCATATSGDTGLFFYGSYLTS